MCQTCYVALDSVGGPQLGAMSGHVEIFMTRQTATAGIFENGKVAFDSYSQQSYHVYLLLWTESP